MKLQFKQTTRPEAKKIARQLADEYGIDDLAGQCLLVTFADAYSLELKCNDEISKDGLVLKDRFGQKKSHPLIASARDARSQKLAALKMLNIDLEPVNDRPGRPPGR